MSEPQVTPPTSQGQTKPDPKSLLQTLRDWKELIVFLIGACTSALGSFWGEGTAKKVSVVVVPFAMVGTIASLAIARRRIQKQNDKRAAQESFFAQQTNKTAFRGTYPFEIGESLPGDYRKREAKGIATRVSASEFRFGVLCGDSGSGKTSMLRTQIKETLESNGFSVHYKSDVPVDLQMGSDKMHDLLVEEFESILRDFSGNFNILILDQFENYFLHYSSVDQRRLLAGCIRDLINARTGCKVLCAIRKEDLINLRDLAPELPEPLSVENLFPIKNFNIEEAKEIILSCAKHDGLIADSNDRVLANLIAEDLQEAGYIRPAELQIVCTALSNNFTVDRYRLAGGSVGILANHIKEALSLQRFPDLGATILRTLCDFNANNRREPKSVEAISKEIGPLDATASVSQQGALVKEHLDQFEIARLVISGIDNPNQVRVYSLTHAYLVNPIRQATTSLSTRQEKANQVLQFYLAQPVNHSIPLPVFLEVNRYASPSILKTPEVRKRLRRSMRVWSIQSATAILFIGLIAAAVFLLSTGGKTWGERRVIASHWDGANLGPVTVHRLQSGFVYTATTSKRGPFGDFVLWDSSGKRLLSRQTPVDYPYVEVSQSGRVLLVPVARDSSNATPEVVFLGTPPKIRKLGILWQSVSRLEFGEGLIFVDNDRVASFLDYPPNTIQAISSDHVPIKVVDLRDGHIYAIPNQVYDGTRAITADGDRLLLNPSQNDNKPLALIDVKSGKQIALLARNNEPVSEFQPNPLGTAVATAHEAAEESIVRLWRTSDGMLLAERHFPADQLPKCKSRDDESREWRLLFSHDGSSILLAVLLSCKVGDTDAIFKPFVVLDSKDLSIRFAVKYPDTTFFRWDEETALAWQADTNRTIVWPLSGSQIRFSGMSLTDKDYLSYFKETKRLFVLRRPGASELWNVSNSTRLWRGDQKDPLVSVIRSQSANVVALTHESGNVDILDLDTGKIHGSPIPQVANSAYSFDEKCGKLIVWSSTTGQITEMTEGRLLFGSFYPSSRCR